MGRRPQPKKRVKTDGVMPFGRVVSRDGLFVVDLRQRIVHWSESAVALLGLSPDEAVGRRCFDVIGGTDMRNARYCHENCTVMANARRGRGTTNFDVHVADRSSQPLIMNVSILLCENPDGEGATTFHLFRDVTSQRRVEQLASVVRPPRLDEDREAQPATCALSPPTERQLEIVRILAAGEDVKHIAAILNLSPVTVRNHIQGAMERFDVRTRVQLISATAQAGLL